jgi:hypothetical protein
MIGRQVRMEGQSAAVAGLTHLIGIFSPQSRQGRKGNAKRSRKMGEAASGSGGKSSHGMKGF